MPSLLHGAAETDELRCMPGVKPCMSGIYAIDVLSRWVSRCSVGVGDGRAWKGMGLRCAKEPLAGDEGEDRPKIRPRKP